MESKLTGYLDKFQIPYKKSQGKIIVQLDFKQEIIIEIQNGDRILINDKLKGWNPLTGMLEVTLNKAMTYSTISFFVIIILSELIKLDNINYDFNPILIMATGWIVIWAVFYKIKLEGFKNAIMGLLT